MAVDLTQGADHRMNQEFERRMTAPRQHQQAAAHPLHSHPDHRSRTSERPDMQRTPDRYV